ncbi:MAG: SDR family NAD(P)-dependent oxidoreductase [Dehalococcoidia bacterium]
MSTLQGKVTVITGAAVGIGAGFARVFAKEGSDLALCDVRPEVIQLAVDLQREHGIRAFGVVADVRSASDVKGFIDGAAARLGGIDYVVANAGVWRATFPLADSWEKGLDDWDILVNTNLRGVFMTGRAAIPHLVARGAGGHILNIATDHIFPPEGTSTGGGTRMDIYDSSKWGINGMTQAWARNLAPHGIRVNALCMDATDSMMIRGAVGERLTDEIVKTWMRPEQIAQLGLDLIAEGLEGRTGENIGAWLGHEVKLPARRVPLPSRFS